MTWQFFPVWIHAAGPFMWKQTLWRQTKMGLQDVEFKHETWIRLFKKKKKRKKASLWLPLSYFNLPLCCLFCVLHFVIDCSHWLWPAPGSQRVGWGSVKTNKHIKKGQLQTESCAEQAFPSLQGRHQLRIPGRTFKQSFCVSLFQRIKPFIFHVSNPV